MYFVFQPWWRLSKLQRRGGGEGGKWERERGGEHHLHNHPRQADPAARPHPRLPLRPWATAQDAKHFMCYLVMPDFIEFEKHASHSYTPPAPPPTPLSVVLPSSSCTPRPHHHHLSVETLSSVYDPKRPNKSLRRHFTSKLSFIPRLYTTGPHHTH